MLYNLSLQGSAPKIFSELNKSHVPITEIVILAFFLLIGVVLNYFVPSKVFTYVTSVATFGAIWVWVIVLVSSNQIQKKT